MTESVPKASRGRYAVTPCDTWRTRALEVSVPAFGCYQLATLMSGDNRSDGFVPDQLIGLACRGMDASEVLGELEAAGWIARETRGNAAGWLLVRYCEEQITTDEDDARKERARDKKRRQRAGAKDLNSESSVPGDVPGDALTQDTRHRTQDSITPHSLQSCGVRAGARDHATDGDSQGSGLDLSANPSLSGSVLEAAFGDCPESVPGDVPGDMPVDTWGTSGGQAGTASQLAQRAYDAALREVGGKYSPRSGEAAHFRSVVESARSVIGHPSELSETLRTWALDYVRSRKRHRPQWWAEQAQERAARGGAMPETKRSGYRPPAPPSAFRETTDDELRAFGLGD